LVNVDKSGKYRSDDKRDSSMDMTAARMLPRWSVYQISRKKHVGYFIQSRIQVGLKRKMEFAREIMGRLK
jgi:hypothetical protein